ncbi:MAG: enoyl-CoA hydratase/isomerase family protein [Rhizobiales bacterium]|nr:enoyl-CoA hydratase/isomerase family protein [Hyphomicrobiales bacterium]
MDGEILFERRGRIGLVTLNRPAALNALNQAMVEALSAALRDCAADEAVAAVIVRANGRAFCAGGDIRHAHDIGREGPPAYEFFRHEYRLNAQIHHFPKPYVALIDGFVMGGGAGISIHGSHRVFAEGAVFSMPETGIGFFTDVGSSYVLARLPHEIGVYCGLTSARLARGDALHVGIATHAAPAAAFDAIVDALAGSGDVEAVLAPYRSATTPPETLGAVDAEIARIFATGTVDAILARLDAVEGQHAPFFGRAADAIRSKSPTSLKIVLRQIRAARALDFDDCIRLDYRIAHQILTGHDFYEGVRAALVDKDRNPRWRPATLAEVDARTVEAHFVPPAEGDLELC